MRYHSKTSFFLPYILYHREGTRFCRYIWVKRFNTKSWNIFGHILPETLVEVVRAFGPTNERDPRDKLSFSLFLTGLIVTLG